jgi:hypothetical protein
MWEIFEQMAAEEPSNAVLINVVSSLSRFGGPRALTLTDQVFQRVHDEPSAATLRSNCFGLFLRLYLTQDEHGLRN